jgi:CBS domain-containing protein
MQLQTIMTRDVQAIPPNMSLRDAARTMKALNVGALPVCQNDKLIGLITDRDITVRAVAATQDAPSCPVSDVMTPNLICCYEDDDVEKAAQRMEDAQIRRLPVIDHNHRLVGIVSLGDLATRSHDGKLSSEVLEQVSRPSQPYA